MRLSFRNLAVFFSLKSIVLAALLAAPMSVLAEKCVTKSGWYVPYNCTVIGKTAGGKFIMTCCK